MVRSVAVQDVQLRSIWLCFDSPLCCKSLGPGGGDGCWSTQRDRPELPQLASTYFGDILTGKYCMTTDWYDGSSQDHGQFWGHSYAPVSRFSSTGFHHTQPTPQAVSTDLAAAQPSTRCTGCRCACNHSHRPSIIRVFGFSWTCPTIPFSGAARL